MKLTWSIFMLFLAHGACVIPASQKNQRLSLKNTLIAEHSRKTHQDHRNRMSSGMDSDSLENLLRSVEMVNNVDENSALKGVFRDSSSPSFQQTKKAFAQMEEDLLNDVPDSDGEYKNPFLFSSFDHDYKIHSICEDAKSGNQGNMANLVYTESADRLLRIIGNGVVSNGYNMFAPPGLSEKPPKTTDVGVAVYIESMSSFRAQTMDFEVDMYLAMGWYDRRLAHNCTNPILVTHKFISDRIWQPDLYFVNSKFAYLQEVTTPNFMLIVYPDGLIFKSMRIDVTLSCMMDFKRFPTDKQECPMVIQSYAYVENLVNLSWHVDPPNFPIGFNAEIKLNDMVITATKYEKCEGPYPMFRGYGNWSCVRGFIVMKRLMMFHLIQTYVPTGMLVWISWMSFWLDPRASPARITLTITTLLTLTTMSNGARQDLPQVAYIKMLDLWLSFNQALIFLVLLEYAFVSYYLTRRNPDCEHRKQQLSFSPGCSQKDVKKRPESPLQGFTCTTPLFHANGTSTTGIIGNGQYLRQRHSSMDSGHAKCPLSQQNSTFSMTAGCVNSATMLCRMAAANAHRLRGHRPSWSDIEAEAVALMAANPTGIDNSKFDVTKPCSKCNYENEMMARRIDKYSRIIFPTAFTIFCIAYWFYYSWWDA